MASHRGRWQAQGGTIQLSEAWSQSIALSARDGIALLASLEQRLSAPEKALRQKAIGAARVFVDRAKAAGGIPASYIRSFPVAGDGSQRRIDLEIHAGKAFVP